MGVIKKKPYEISVWEDRLVTEDDISYYKEIKLAVIGSDKMESPNRVFDPVLIENVNGEKTLTFSLVYKYYDEYSGELITNPFYAYLINERKIKLFYNDEWNEFVIKECEETSTENTFSYTAKELFSLELAKGGYNVTLNTDLNNNQGTIIELAKKVLENTDWQVDEDNSDLLTQYVQEPLYTATITAEDGVEVLNLDNNELETIAKDEIIYIFYSYIENKETNAVQFIRELDRPNFFIDDDNVIKSTNYRFVQPIKYAYNEETGEISIVGIASVESTPYLSNQGYCLVYKIQTTYDPVMDRTVDIYQMPYKDSIQEIYHFLDYNYATSDVVLTYITNGSNFELFEDGKIQGWYNTTPTSSADEDIPVLQPIRTTTIPSLDANSKLQFINQLSEINGYIELKFQDTLTNTYENTYFNEGFKHSASLIDHVSAGEKFVLRMRYYTKDDQDKLVPEAPTDSNSGLRVIIGKYEVVDEECYFDEEAKTAGQVSKVKAYKILPDEILFDFNGGFTRSPNLITNGIFSDDKKQYIVDTVIQVPSTAYIYKTTGDDTEYIWDCKNKVYVDRGSTQTTDIPVFADYYLTTAAAQYSLTNEQMADPTLKLGIFLYTIDNNLVDKYIYLQDIQLTRYYEDANHEVVTIGNIPTAVANEAHKYYLKPITQIQSSEVNTYGTLDALAYELGADVDTITPVYNEDSEKILSIEASQSNYFNILQDLCETFECWLDIRVAHDTDGSIMLDENFNPIKKVAFKEYAGKDNFAGFKNGINLKGITRNIDSNEIVTKLIVDPVQSQYTDSGSVAIQNAKSNYSGQSYILNFSYYLNRGLITESLEDFNENMYSYNSQFNQLNKDIRDLTVEQTQILNSLTKLSAQRNTYTALIDAAQIDYNKAIEDFYKLTNCEYDTFVEKYQNLEKWAIDEQDKTKNYLENDTVLDVVARIYVATVTMNNYSGILTNLDKEYQDLSLKYYGARDYSISVVSIPGDGAELHPSTKVAVDDYISGLKFRLLDENGGSVIFSTSPNDRIFTASNESPYQYIEFMEFPSSYRLKYYKGNKAYTLEPGQTKRFEIYDSVTGETLDKQFILIPTEEYATDHKGIQEQIDEKIEDKNELEKEFYKKYSRFIQEGTWSSQDYIDAELYYFDALQVSDTSAQPKVSYTIDVLEVSQFDGLENYDFRVGDKTYIEDTDFFGYIYQSTDVRESIERDENAPTYAPIDDETIYADDIPVIVTARSPVREEVIVSEVEWHFDEPDNNVITVQNYKTRFEDLFQRISATVQTVQRNEITYPKTSSILDQSGLINSTLLADSLNGIGGTGFALTTNGSVAATQDGLLIRDLMNPSNVMRLASSGLQVSTDGGVTWGTAVSAEGISTDVLTAGTINTQKIWLMDGDNPSFRWDKSGLNAYGLDADGNESYDLKTYVRFDKYGLYGIKNDEEYVATSLEDVEVKAHFGVTWKGFFIKNSYEGGGHVEITSDNDFRVFNTINNEEHEKIKIGALEWGDGITSPDASGATSAPTLYGIRIKNNAGEEVMKTGDDGNLTVSGTINALAGNFGGVVNVGNIDNTHIIIDGSNDNPTISSSNFSEGAGTGWTINSAGDAMFSNVSVRGAIKTAVFEYEEIQAVGGAFLFRPSSTIKTARYIPLDEPTEEIGEDGEIYTVDYYDYIYSLTTDTTVDVNKTYYQEIEENKYVRVLAPIDADIDTYYERRNRVYNDLIVTLEQPFMFTKNNWVKISNYNSLDVDPAADLTTYGLVHIYKISDIIMPEESGDDIIPDDSSEPSDEIEYDTYEIILEGACAVLDRIILENVIGGALIDFGSHKQEGGIDVPGDNNYGIGINSSDNYVNLPARAISLFETTIHPDEETKVTYNYRGILGTLPRLPLNEMSDIYADNMIGTQGIYTDNMYIGNANQYLSFYTDKETGDKKLRIRAGEILYETSPGNYENVKDPYTKYIWYDSDGAHAASGIPNITFDGANPNTFGYNSLMASDRLALRYNANEYVFIDDKGLNINHISYYVPVTLTEGDPSELGLYELINNEYVLTTDTTVEQDKTYYRYEPNNPTVNLAASYGEKTIIGDTTKGVHIEIDNNRLGFYNAASSEPISYLDSSKLYIPYSVVLNEMIVGTKEVEGKTTDLWAWKVVDDHLRLVWKGGVIN